MTEKQVDIGGTLAGALTSPVEADSAPVNVLAGALAAHKGEGKKGALEESPHLLAVREAVSGLRAGTLPPDDYYLAVSKVHQKICELLGLFEMAQVQRELEKASEAEQNLADQTEEDLAQIEEGLARLVNYLDTGELVDLEEGLAQVEAGYLALDKTHDLAIEMADDDSDEEDMTDE